MAIGFNNDKYLYGLIKNIIRIHKCDCFVQTGVNTGTTICNLYKKYDHDVFCIGCGKTEDYQLNGLKIYDQKPLEFINWVIDSIYEETIFYLDGDNSTYPLRKEIRTITTKFKKVERIY